MCSHHSDCQTETHASLKRRWGLFRSLALLFIRLYQLLLSPILGRQCRFYPSCSNYALLSFTYQPIWKAFFSSIWRILRCNPYGQGGLDFPAGISEEQAAGFFAASRKINPVYASSQKNNLEQFFQGDKSMFTKEYTLALIKPDGVQDGKTGAILKRIEEEGFTIRGLKKITLTLAQAQEFYSVHRERPFFGELTEFMCQGPIVAMSLERENAVKHWRDVIGATDPAQAAENTIRKLHARSKAENAVHGSDSVENAKIETAFFFSGLELI